MVLGIPADFSGATICCFRERPTMFLSQQKTGHLLDPGAKEKLQFKLAVIEKSRGDLSLPCCVLVLGMDLTVFHVGCLVCEARFCVLSNVAFFQLRVRHRMNVALFHPGS